VASPEELTKKWEQYKGDKILRLTHPDLKTQPVKTAKKGLKFSISKLKKLDLFKTEITYETAKRMNDLWETYISNVSGNRSLGSTLKEKIYDIQGAHIRIKFASNPCQVGIQGIVFFDSSNMLWLCTENNEVKKIAKAESILSIRCGTIETDVLGSAMLRKFHLRLTKPHKKLQENQSLLTLK